MIISAYKSFLKQIPIFSNLSDDALDVLTGITKFNSYKRRSFVYYPQDPSDSIHFVYKGRVKIGTFSQDGKEVLKAIAYPSQGFGEMSILGEAKRKDYAVPMDKEVTVASINSGEFQKLMNQYPELNLMLINQIGSKLRATEERLEALIFKDARTRIVEFLKERAASQGHKVGFETLLRQCPTHKDIASLTDTSRQTVTTVFSELRRQNVIHIDRKNILIRDIHQLK